MLTRTHHRRCPRVRSAVVALLVACLLCVPPAPIARAQDPVTGAFQGRVFDASGAPIPNATVQIINQLTEVPVAKRTNANGEWYQGLLQPGFYTIRVAAPGFSPKTVNQRVVAQQSNTVIPVPVRLDRLDAATTPTNTTATASPTPTTTDNNNPGRQPASQDSDAGTSAAQDRGVAIESTINTTDARRNGVFVEEEVSKLPLGSVTLVRSFDELALLVPGVALPPQTLGDVAGPGVGAGVGSAGQFSVNGLRSRANNFTVDGSDNNDEDIGVRRQGFLSLVPQPIESIREFQIITLLAPAQYGRNFGGQVNAISKSGGNQTHGTVFGFLNTSQLNAPNAFDTTSGNTQFNLRAGNNQAVTRQDFRFNTTTGFFDPTGAPRPIPSGNQSGGKDSFTLGQFGIVMGGPLVPDKLFYFFSGEGQILNASKEVNFAVPTVEQRGVGGTGASGIFRNPFNSSQATDAFPTSIAGDAVFSLFPFPNNPTGVYDANTFTQTLPANGQGKVFSGKVDYNFNVRERQQQFVARYNLTDDYRDIPATGGALFSTLRPRVRTQNVSTFLNSELSGADSTRPVFNQLRLSYGRTKLNFEARPNRDFLVPSDFFPNDPFLLNAPVLFNVTSPSSPGVRNTGDVNYVRFLGFNTEFFNFGGDPLLGPVGQLIIAGFSPVGYDVFNFPQSRVNNTYQLADTVTTNFGRHSFAFGADLRRTELNSDLPRNSRPLVTFNGLPFGNSSGFSSLDFAAAGAPSGFFQSLALAPSDISLRYHQLNFFGQDEWRVRPNLSVSYGLRYEYNTVPRERNERIESTFASQAVSEIPGLQQFVGGRTQIFEDDRNNFAPRVGVAYSPRLFGDDRTTVFRAGYGIFYDQIIGAVVSQSRNAFPNFLTVNFGGGLGGTFNCDGTPCRRFQPFNPVFTTFGGEPIINFSRGVNQLNSNISARELLRAINAAFPNALSPTLPARQLETPMAHHYSFTFEQQIGANMIVSVAYVGTLGRNLLRFTTPNGGQNNVLVPQGFDVSQNGQPAFFGTSFAPLGRTNFPGLGAISRFETTGRSRYDALQVQARGRFRRSLQYQINYTFSRTMDDASDVFDLAGSFALPQNSQTFAGEYARSNMDAPHRVAYSLLYTTPQLTEQNRALRFLFGGIEVTSTGMFQSGQPFTVNSIYDVNLDGNLTDRLNTTNGITETGDRSQPLRFTGNTFGLLAPLGTDGSVGRNSFRAGNIMLFNVALAKSFRVTETQSIIFRTEIFNLTDRENFGVPVRFLEAPGFGRAVDTVTPGRRIQFSLKYSF